MLAEFGCRYALVGHSERRQLHGETDAVVAAKAVAALDGGLTPIVCVGETLAERNAGQTQAVVGRQLDAAIAVLQARMSLAVLAYEPVWAIGTGRDGDAAGSAGSTRISAATAAHDGCRGHYDFVWWKCKGRQRGGTVRDAGHRRWAGRWCVVERE